MNPNIIKTFIEEFPNCPKCGNHLYIKAKQDGSADSHRFAISTASDRININITSSYFINTSKNKFEFSISLIDGNIIHSDKANQFISLYDIDIILYKECVACSKNEIPEIFYQSIHIFYDRTVSSFAANPWYDLFSFVYFNKCYYYSHSYKNMRSVLSIQSLEDKNKRTMNAPFIPFGKFSFREKERLYAKLNSIMLLM